jgi:DNA polymerase IV (DinB-like DNA polymerase)
MKQRIVLLLDMDAFFAMIEERENPRFKGRPVVVGADPKEGKGRGVVSTCNYKAREYGIHSAMPISQAWRLCSQAVFLPVNGALYSKVSDNIMEIIRKHATILEQVSQDEAYVDLSFTGSYIKAEKLAERIRKDIFKKEQLTASCGIAENKMVAKMACKKAKPNGVLVVEKDKIDQFLFLLKIQEIPGVGPKTAIVLEKFFKKRELKVEDVKKATREELIDLMGVAGDALYDKVRGIDETPIVVNGEIKSIGKEHTFAKDTRDSEEIFSVFYELILGIQKELQEQELSFKIITVVCRFHGFETHTKSKTLKKVSKDGKVLKKESMRLLLRFLTENLKPVRLIGVRIQVAGKFSK